MHSDKFADWADRLQKRAEISTKMKSECIVCGHRTGYVCRYKKHEGSQTEVTVSHTHAQLSRLRKQFNNVRLSVCHTLVLTQN